MVIELSMDEVRKCVSCLYANYIIPSATSSLVELKSKFSVSCFNNLQLGPELINLELFLYTCCLITH